MSVNVGKIDKGVRLVMGVGLLSLLFVLEKPLGYIGFVGLVPVITAFLGFCPLYKIVGLSTCSVNTGKK